MAEKGALLLLTLAILLCLNCRVAHSRSKLPPNGPPGGFGRPKYQVYEGSSVDVSVSLASAPKTDVTATVTCSGPDVEELDPNAFNVTFVAGESGPIVTTITALPDDDPKSEMVLCVVNLSTTEGLSQFTTIIIHDTDENEHREL